jgi:hypothetical protein
MNSWLSSQFRQLSELKKRLQLAWTEVSLSQRKWSGLAMLNEWCFTENY